MVLIKKEIINKIPTYYVDKDITDDKMQKLKNTIVKKSQIKLILTEDADVYTVDEKLLLRFRKNKLTKTNIGEFYDNIIDFAMKKTDNRGSTSGSKHMVIGKNPKIMTNIFGFFDTFSPKQKMKMKTQKIQITARPCWFNVNFPEKYKQTIPLIQEIDTLYKKYIPASYKKQYDKAKQTHFRIANTSFTTVTTNVNFQTTIHTDTGDDADGFGNLSVIEYGKYNGGETCFPQYGVGVDVRIGDILFMDVHQPHGNLPIDAKTEDAKRLSIVCYLRHNLWEKTKGKSKAFFDRQVSNVKKLTESMKKTKTNKNKTKSKKTNKTRKVRNEK